MSGTLPFRSGMWRGRTSPRRAALATKRTLRKRLYIVRHRGFLQRFHQSIHHALHTTIHAVDDLSMLLSIQTFTQLDQILQSAAALEQLLVGQKHLLHVVLTFFELHVVVQEIQCLLSAFFLPITPLPRSYLAKKGFQSLAYYNRRRRHIHISMSIEQHKKPTSC